MGRFRKNRTDWRDDGTSQEAAAPAAPSTSAVPIEGMGKMKKSRPNNFQRAKAVFEKIQSDKRAAHEARQKEKERRENAMSNYMNNKKKMNKALTQKTRKGQPNLGAQISVILERLQQDKKK